MKMRTYQYLWDEAGFIGKFMYSIKSTFVKDNVDKFNLIKTKVCSFKDTVREIKKTEWKKYLQIMQIIYAKNTQITLKT